MKGIAIARDLLLLGAESATSTPLNEIVDAHEGWKVAAEQWAALRQRMEEHRAEADPLRERLCGPVGLHENAYWLIMLCAAVEWHPEAAAGASILAETERVHVMTPMTLARLLRTVLGVPVAESLAEAMESGRARRLNLVEAADSLPDRPHSQQPIRLAPAEVIALLGGGAAVGSAQPAWSEADAPAAETVYAAALATGAAQVLEEERVLGLRAINPRAARQFALDIASTLGTPLHTVRVRDELPSASALGRIREGLLLLDFSGFTKPLPFLLIEELRGLLGRVLLGLGPEATAGGWPCISVEQIGLAESRRVWSLAFGEPGRGAALAQRFRVNLPEAREAVRAAAVSGRLREKAAADPEEAVAEQLLHLGARRMGKLVTQIRGAANMKLLVATPALQRKLAEIVTWFKSSGRVFGEMAFPQSSPLGRGLVCLFSGPPGTGKTFAAQCLASAFGLNLYRIDLSQVVSKYIGETEKALAAVFDEAEAGHGVLLCDEADALFGRRSEVKDAHDRYANIEVSYLLQRLEAFEGVVILATNLRNNVDPAFLRRLRFLVEFPMPDSTMRRKLWEQALPAAPFRPNELDLAPYVDRFRLAGGNIQNVGLLAAHLAAARPDGRLTHEDLALATYRELEKTGQPRSAADFGPLAVHLPKEVA